MADNLYESGQNCPKNTQFSYDIPEVFICSKSMIEIPEQCVKFIQS